MGCTRLVLRGPTSSSREEWLRVALSTKGIRVTPSHSRSSANRQGGENVGCLWFWGRGHPRSGKLFDLSPLID